MARSRQKMSSSPPAPISARSCRTCCATSRKLFQVHAASYANPGQLPAGAVLVVGAGASGAQIAEELHRAGRRVFLSVGQTTRLPRRYRGHDLIWWFEQLGLFDRRPGERGPVRVYPAITGAYGGHTIDFRRFAADGITLLGRVVAARGRVLDIAPVSPESSPRPISTMRPSSTWPMITCATAASISAEDPAARAKLPDPSCVTEPIRRARSQRRRHRRRDLGNRLWRRFRLDRLSRLRRQRRCRSSAAASPPSAASISSACNG